MNNILHENKDVENIVLFTSCAVSDAADKTKNILFQNLGGKTSESRMRKRN